MALTAFLLAGQVAAGLGQTIYGMSQAKNLAENRPIYKIPEEIYKNMSQAERLAYEGLPEEQRQEFIQELDRQMSLSISASSDRKAGIGAIASTAQRANDATMKLLSVDTQQRMANIRNVFNMRNKMAQYEEKAFNINFLQPYQQDMQAAQQFQAAGLQNIFNATQNVSMLEAEGIGLNFRGPNTITD